MKIEKNIKKSFSQNYFLFLIFLLRMWRTRICVFIMALFDDKEK